MHRTLHPPRLQQYPTKLDTRVSARLLLFSLNLNIAHGHGPCLVLNIFGVEHRKWLYQISLTCRKSDFPSKQKNFDRVVLA